MNRIIVEIDNEANTKLFISLMQNLKFVKSAITDKKDSIDDLKPLSEEDWIKPGRPATDLEHEQMLKECEAEYEAGLFVPIEEAEEETLNEIKKWRDRNTK